MARGKKLPDDEARASSNRESWARSRARTGNWSSRAYNLAVQDCARWVRDEHPDIWQDYYDARCAEQKARVEGGGMVECSHDIIEQVETTVALCICTTCRRIVGDSQPGVPPDGYHVFSGDGGRVQFARLARTI